MVDWLFKKYPRAKRVCVGCGGNFGLIHPNYPYCTFECKEKHFKPPDRRTELPYRPPDKNAIDVC